MSQVKNIVKTHTLNVEIDDKGWLLESGQVLPVLEIAYETYGELNKAKDNAILICAPLTADAHAAGYHSEDEKSVGWWDSLIGPGKAIDTDKFFVISSNLLGGCKGTTGPASINPNTKKEFGQDFPHITIGDMVRTQKELVDYFGIKKLWAAIGGSMGGLQSLKWAIDFPDMVARCAVIAATSKLSAQALGFEIVSRQAIVNDPTFNKGNYYENGQPKIGLGLARKVAHLTYLSPTSMEQKFARGEAQAKDPDNFATDFEVETYLDYQAEKFCERFDANSYLHITWAMDHFDLVEEHGSLKNAFKRVSADLLNVNLSTDWLFPPSESRKITSAMLNSGGVVSNVELDSPYGHDAFLLEVKNLGEVLERFLNDDPLKDIKRDKESYQETRTYRYLRQMIGDKSRMLDLGCGKGKLIDYLWREKKIEGVGVDCDYDKILSCLDKNVPVLQLDLNEDLSLIEDKSFDVVVLNRTMEQVINPQKLLREMLRIAPNGIVAFPNFGNWRTRLHLTLLGTMPKNDELPFNWYDTPNIHFFTLKDFKDLMKKENIEIEEEVILNNKWSNKVLCALGLKNLGSEMVIVKIKKSKT